MEENNSIEVARQPIIAKSQSKAYRLMQDGKYEETIETLLNLNELDCFCKAIEDDLHQNKNHASAIKDRAWYKRLFSSNVKDIGEVLYEQNTALATLYVLIRLQTLSSKANTKLLAELYNYADKEASTTGKEKNAVKESIIAILEKNKQEFQRNAVRDNALMKLLKFAQNMEDAKGDIKTQIENMRNRFDERYASVLEQLDEKLDKNIFSQTIETLAKTDEVYSANIIDVKLNMIDKQKANRENVESGFAKMEKKIKYFIIAFSTTTAILVIGLISCLLM